MVWTDLFTERSQQTFTVFSKSITGTIFLSNHSLNLRETNSQGIRKEIRSALTHWRPELTCMTSRAARRPVSIILLRRSLRNDVNCGGIEAKEGSDRIPDRIRWKTCSNFFTGSTNRNVFQFYVEKWCETFLSSF